MKAIHLQNISKSINRFQLAVDSANVQLDMAISPGTWLMLSNLVKKMGSVIGYRFGVN